MQPTGAARRLPPAHPLQPTAQTALHPASSSSGGRVHLRHIRAGPCFPCYRRGSCCGSHRQSRPARLLPLCFGLQTICFLTRNLDAWRLQQCHCNFFHCARLILADLAMHQRNSPNCILQGKSSETWLTRRRGCLANLARLRELPGAYSIGYDSRTKAADDGAAQAGSGGAVGFRTRIFQGRSPPNKRPPAKVHPIISRPSSDRSVLKPTAAAAQHGRRGRAPHMGGAAAAMRGAPGGRSAQPDCRLRRVVQLLGAAALFAARQRHADLGVWRAVRVEAIPLHPAAPRARRAPGGAHGCAQAGRGGEGWGEGGKVGAHRGAAGSGAAGRGLCDGRCTVGRNASLGPA